MKNFFNKKAIANLARPVPVLILAGVSFLYSCRGKDSVKFIEEQIVIPTYEIGKPEVNPTFYVPKDVQGTKAIIYPYSMMDQLTDKKSDVTYKALVLENEYIRICVLPELGGRLYYAVDKTNNYDFIYHNHVIKPALIGTTGAWISGGGEWNANHHHRISAHMPCDYRIVESKDGSKTIWVGEYEKRHSTRWEVGLTLRPGKAYVEKDLKMLNVTPVERSFLYFANIAVHANENYQVIFPPDVEKAVYHHKIEFTTWPVSKQFYRGIDFTKGYDISWWKNTFAPTSFFAWGSEMDFFAGIDHGKNAGTVLVGDHNILPGKKFWNWGNNDISRMWDNLLTDKDGPYIELMMGAYSDNQPDYSWYHPFTAKEAKMYLYPVKKFNSIKNANRDFAINLEVKDGKIITEINSTGNYNHIVVKLTGKDNMISENEISIGPKTTFGAVSDLPSGVSETDLKLTVSVKGGEELISWQPKPKRNEPMPPVYTDPIEPKEIKNPDDLYLTGLRLEQFFNPRFNPRAYYYEALKKDPAHLFTNTQLGINYLNDLLPDSAELHLRVAVNQVTRKYTTPKYTEPLYYLGVCLFRQGKMKEAYNWLARAAWSLEWTSPACFLMAVMDCQKLDFGKALENVNKSIFYNNSNTEAILLKSIILRNTNRFKEALENTRNLISWDPLNMGALYELIRLSDNIHVGKDKKQLTNDMLNLMRDDPDNYLETSSRYANAGFYREAARLLEIAQNSGKPRLVNYPMIYYYSGYFLDQLNDKKSASENYKKASGLPGDYCSPYGVYSAKVLSSVIEKVPTDAFAHYYLGNLLCDHQPDAALGHWLKAIEINNSVPVFYRNASFVYANIRDDMPDANKFIEKAIELNPNDPLYFVEADIYDNYSGFSPEKATELYDKNVSTVLKTDEAAEHWVFLCIYKGDYTGAIELMNKRHFHSYETFEGNMHIKWVDAHILRGKKYFETKQYDKALEDFQAATEFPVNLDLLRDSKMWMAYYYIGLTYKVTGNEAKAKEYFEKCAGAENIGGWWGTAGPQVLYCKALSLRELGFKAKADSAFRSMVTFGTSDFNFKPHAAEDMASVKKRYDLRKRKGNALLSIAFGNLGMGNKATAAEYFKRALVLDPYNLDAKIYSNP
jgi:tetratricopeptide (TPR) repeat protein